MLGAAAVVNNATLRNSIIRREAVIEPGAVLEDCIVMDYVRISRNARLRRVIVDRHNHIEASSEISFDRQADESRYIVTPGGVVVIPLGDTEYYAGNSRGSGIGYGD